MLFIKWHELILFHACLFLQVLNVLRPMTHEASTTMVYDERYTPLLKLANLATITRVCCWGTPPFNPAALMALIDRWRPETHSFHLPCGEMTVTLKDVAMILGVKIQGSPWYRLKSYLHDSNEKSFSMIPLLLTRVILIRVDMLYLCLFLQEKPKVGSISIPYF